VADVSRLQLHVLGGFQARLPSGASVGLPTRKTQALLAYLALPPGQAHPRDKLAALLWGETPEAEARGSLRQALYTLRKALPSGALRQGDAAALEPSAVDVDVAAFERAVELGTPATLAEAARLYRGDLLAGLAVKEAPAFEEWLLGERERLRELALEGLAKLLAHQRASGAAEAAVQTALKLAALDPLQEPVHRTLMRLYAQLGRRGAALRQYQACVAVLQQELGVEPEAETQQLYQELVRERSPARERGARGPARAESPVAETRLIAREAELARLRQALDDIAQGDGRLVLVSGEAGIGKSRLVAELAAEAAHAGGRVLVGRAYESEQILAFGPWVDALRATALTAVTAPLNQLDPVWRAEIARLVPETGIPPPSAPVEHRILFEAVGRLLAALAGGSRLLLVLEDLHWADEMSCRLLAFVGRRLAEWPILLVATAREEELPDAPALRSALDELAREDRLDALALGPLSREATATLVGTLARAGTDAATVARLGEVVWRASEGNPLMAVETLRAWREGERTMPARVREVVTRRLDRLGERAQQVASVAAVIGRECEFALLERAAGLGEDASAQGLEELVRRRVLHGVGERFDFTHDRIREAAYDRILGARRRILHRRVAEAIEALYPDTLADHAVALGRHYREAEAWEPAARHFDTAGSAARERAANREAVACFEAVLDCLQHLAAGRERSERVIETVLRQETALMGLGEFGRSLDRLREARGLAEALGDRGRLGRIFGRVAYNLGSIGDLDGAIANAEQARALAVELGDTRGRVSSNVVLARGWYARGDYGRAMDAVRDNDGLERDTHPGEATRGNFSFSRIWGVLAQAELGQFAEARSRAAHALRVAAQEFGPHTEVWAHLGAGRLYLVQGDVPRAIDVLEPSLPRCETDGDLAVYFSRTAASLGGAYALSGRVDEAVALLQRADRHAESLGFAYGHALVIATLAEALGLAGDVAGATGASERALALARRLGQRGWEAWALRARAEVAGAAGDRESAVARYREAIALADERAMAPLAAHCRVGLGRVTGDRELVATALACYGALDMPFWVSRAERLL
jgi:DNA-binding SARP family transcriptional activator